LPLNVLDVVVLHFTFHFLQIFQSVFSNLTRSNRRPLFWIHNAKKMPKKKIEWAHNAAIFILHVLLEC